MGDGASDVWEDPERVRAFAARDADLRLEDLLARFPEPARTRVLDLGCAGGRNAVLLAERGFDVVALDRSSAMVAATRERLRAVLGRGEAERRVVEGDMEDLSRFADGCFHLVVALGIFHQAASEAAYDRALDEAVRVLAAGGLLLVANFAPGTGTLEEPYPRLSGTRFCYRGFSGEPLALREPREIDDDFARRGLVTEVPTKRVERCTADRRRVTANALYRKPGTDPPQADPG